MNFLNWLKTCRDVYFFVGRNKKLLNQLADEFEQKREEYRTELTGLVRKIDAAKEFHEFIHTSGERMAEQNVNLKKENEELESKIEKKKKKSVKIHSQ
jgi:hypothetical protein